MNKVKILSDTTCDITNSQGRDLTIDLGIDYIPFNVTFGEDESYRDVVDIHTKEMFQKVEELGVLPKTSAPSIKEFRDFFNKYLEKDMDIFYVGISSELSSGFSSACIAAGEYLNKRIFILDGRNLATGTTLLLYKACKLRDEGLSAKDIFIKVSSYVDKVRSRFIVDNLNWICKGGRCTPATKFFGNLLQIKPILLVKDGQIIVEEKVRGKRNALNFMFSEFVNDLNNDNVDMDIIFVERSGDSTDAAVMQQKLIDLGVDIDIITVTKANCIISAHCGPDSTGILYLKKRL